MLLVPLEEILSWPAPNYDNPPTRGPEFWIVSAIFLTAASVVVAIRLWTRIFIRQWLGLDDLLVALAFLCSVGVTVAVGIGNARYNWNRHAWDIPPVHIEPALKVLYFARIFWTLATTLVRLSVLCLYYRLVRAAKAPRYFHWILHAMTAFTIVMLLCFFFIGVIPYMPIGAYWAWPDIVDSKCINDGAAIQISGVLNTVAESILATLPLLAVFRLNVSKQQRWTVVSLLSLGFLVACTGCFRTFYIWKALHTNDISWWSSPQWICSKVEVDLALICACAAPLRPLTDRVIRRTRRWRGLPSPPSTVMHHQHSRSNSGISLSTKASHVERNPEEVAEWTSVMERTFDLDGIANDGLGYTISISGPARRRKKPWKKSWPQTTAMPQGKNTPRKMSQDVMMTNLEIPVKTELSIRESWHAVPTGGRRPRWPSAAEKPEDVDFKNVEFGCGQERLEYLGDSSFLNHTTDAPMPKRTEESDFDNEDGMEIVEALPAMPHPATYPSRSSRSGEYC